MTIDPANLGSGNAALIERVKGILTKPQAEWDKIEPEPAEVQPLYLRYALPLAILSAACILIGGVVFGHTVLGVHYRVPLVNGIVEAVLQVALQLAGVFVLAYVANALAPSFGGQQNIGQAHKLAVYGATASLLSGVFGIFPPLGALGLLLSLYSLVLLYLGLPKLMKGPEDKRIAYFISIIAVCIVVWLVIGAVMGAVRMSMGGLGGGYQFGQQQTEQVEASVRLPGGGTLNVDELEAQAAALQTASTTEAIDPARLERLLPQTLPGGFRRSASTTATAMGAANAEGVYENGEQRIEVTLTHMGGLGAITNIAQAANVQHSNTSTDGFTRTNVLDGRTIVEDVSTSRGAASYAVFGNGVAITAEGSGGVSLDQVRGAVEMLNIARLESQFD